MTISVANMVLAAINAIAVVMYPMLRRTDKDSLPRLYEVARNILMALILGGIVFYYPMYKVLVMWLPQYTDSLRYAAVLLPICVYESKMSLLVNTYFNTLRLEKLLFKCNMAALGLSVVLTVLSIYVINSVIAAMISILLVLVFRCVLCEAVLSTKIQISVLEDVLVEFFMTVAFIICNWYFGFVGMLIYAGCYVLYLLIKKNDILETVSFIKSMR